VPLTIKLRRESNQATRPPMLVSVGPHVEGAALPHADTSDTATALAAVRKRIGVKPPKVDRTLKKEFLLFVEDWLEEHTTPISPDADLSFETWLKDRPYPEWRKEELRKVNDGIARFTLKEKDAMVKAFLKDESYPEYKHARGIYARSDVFKCLFGPLVSEIEKDLYKNKEFVKHVPVPDRPKYIQDLLVTTGDLTGTTDFTAYETSFTEEVMKMTSQPMFMRYTWVLDHPFYRRLFLRLQGKNSVYFKWFYMEIVAKRMSGEMDTSCSNGFANLMINKFLCKYYGLGDLRIGVEGDDGIMKTVSGRFPPPEAYARLGFTVKIAVKQTQEEASFCGIIYHPDDLINVRDPRTVLVDFAWANARYAGARKSKLLSLLRVKSLSFLYQYPGCPVIQELALYGLRVTKSHDVRSLIDKKGLFNLWQRDTILAALASSLPVKEVGMSTRLLVERLYGLSLEEQYRIESMLRNKTDLSPFEVEFDIPRPWSDYYQRYVRQVSARDIVCYNMSSSRIDLIPLIEYGKGIAQA